MTDILKTLYTDVRKYLIAMLDGADPNTIVRAFNNNVPLPNNAIMMYFRANSSLDQFSTEVVDGNQITFNSVSGTMELNFYGDNSFEFSQKIATCWNTHITTQILVGCAPLNQPRIRDLSFVNDKGLFELRYMLELELQYNTKYEKQVNIATQVDLESINAI